MRETDQMACRPCMDEFEYLLSSFIRRILVEYKWYSEWLAPMYISCQLIASIIYHLVMIHYFWTIVSDNRLNIIIIVGWVCVVVIILGLAIYIDPMITSYRIIRSLRHKHQLERLYNEYGYSLKRFDLNLMNNICSYFLIDKGGRLFLDSMQYSMISMNGPFPNAAVYRYINH